MISNFNICLNLIYQYIITKSILYLSFKDMKHSNFKFIKHLYFTYIFILLLLNVFIFYFNQEQIIKYGLFILKIVVFFKIKITEISVSNNYVIVKKTPFYQIIIQSSKLHDKSYMIPFSTIKIITFNHTLSYIWIKHLMFTRTIKNKYFRKTLLLGFSSKAINDLMSQHILSETNL